MHLQSIKRAAPALLSEQKVVMVVGCEPPNHNQGISAILIAHVDDRAREQLPSSQVSNIGKYSLSESEIGETTLHLREWGSTPHA